MGSPLLLHSRGCVKVKAAQSLLVASESFGVKLGSKSVISLGISKVIMLPTWAVMCIITLIWVLIGGVTPFVIPNGPNKGVYQTMAVTTAVCCWLHWFITYMSQLNPLIGPQLSNGQIFMMGWAWDLVD
ncbi:unnamed protein product [Clavelina lepadiformis]|uniref:Uncharacterized protein n=1 Tax=Clavelina lepadiformis TaxID=159417 RepID=A0ABP0GF51_CLALP